MVTALAPLLSYAHGVPTQPTSEHFKLNNALTTLPAGSHYKVLIQSNIERVKNQTPNITTTLIINGKKAPLTTTGRFSLLAHE